MMLKRGTASRNQVWKLELTANNEFRIRIARADDEYICLVKGQLCLQECTAAKADIWVLKPVADNPILSKSCFIISKDSKKLIDIPESTSKEGVNIIIYEPNYRYNQRWNILRAGVIYVIKSQFNGLNLDVEGESFENGTNIIQWSSHGGVNQFWMFERVS